MNATSEMDSDKLLELDNPSLRYAFLLTVMVITTIFIVIGNSLVIWAVYRNSVLQTPTNFILTSLAVIHFLSGSIAIPLELYNRQEGATCSYLLTTALSLLSYMFGLNSGLHYIAATADRYVAVTRPLRYTMLITSRGVAIFVGVSWTGSVIITALAFGIFASVTTETTSIRCTGEHYTDPVQQGLMYSIATAIILFCTTLLILNLRILQIAIHQFRRIAEVQILFRPRENTRIKVKAVKTTLVIVGVFCICWLPSSLSHIFAVVVDFPITTYILILDGSFVMISFGSAVNPLIYCYQDRSFRHAFLEAIGQLMKIFKSNS